MRIDTILMIVEETLDIDVSKVTRKPNYVDAKMIVYKIAVDLDVKHIEIARALNKHHSSITNYSKNFDFYSKNIEFNEKYLKCLNALQNFSEKQITKKQQIELDIKKARREIKKIMDLFRLEH